MYFDLIKEINRNAATPGFLRSLTLPGIVLLGLTSALTGCSDGSSNARQNDSTTTQVEIPTVPTDPITLSIAVTDTKGNPVMTTGTVTVLQDGEALFGLNQYVVAGGSLEVLASSTLDDEDNNGVPDVAASVTLKFDGFDGYLGKTRQFPVSAYGTNELTIDLLSLAGDDSLTVVEEKATLADKELVEPPPGSSNPDQPVVVFEALANAPDKPSAAVYLSPGLEAYDEAGNELDTSELTVVTVGVPPDALAKSGVLPATGVVSLENKTKLESDGVVAGTFGERSKIQLNSLGSVQTIIRDASGSKVSNVNPGSPITLEIGLPSGSINPLTQADLAVGDLVPVWSRDDDGSSWTYMGQFRIQEGSTGELRVYVETPHLSHFNVAFAEVVDPCSGRIYVRNPLGEPFAVTGILQMENERVFLKDAYRGASDGQLVFEDIPDEPTDILFLSGDGSAVTVEPSQTSLAQESEGTITGSLMTGVNLCRSDGTTLTLKSVNNAEPVIVVEAARSWHMSGGDFRLWSMDEGDSPADAGERVVSLTLVNPPDTPVSLSYAFADLGGGPVDATEGIDFVVEGVSGGTFELSKAQPAAEIRIKTLPDVLGEDLNKRFELQLPAAADVPFASGHAEISVFGAVRDDDYPVLTSVSVSDVTEGGDILLQAVLDNPAASASHIVLDVRPDSRASATPAVPGYDYLLAESLLWRNSPGGFRFAWSRPKFLPNRIFLEFNQGDTIAQASIPTPDNSVVDGTRSIEFQATDGHGINVTDNTAAVTSWAAISDNDVASGVAPSSYSVTAMDSYGVPFAAAQLQEGAGMLYQISLDDAAQADTTFMLEHGTVSDQVDFLVWQGGSLTNVKTAGQITIPAGEQTAKIFLSTFRDFKVTPDYSTGQVTVQPPAGIAGTPTDLQMTVENTDVTTVYINTFVSPPEVTEGKVAAIDVNLAYNSNNENVSVVLSNFDIDVDDIAPAVEGEDFSMPERSIPVLTGFQDKLSRTVNIFDDEEGEASQNLFFSTQVLSGLLVNANRLSDGDVLTTEAIIIDDDKLVISAPDVEFNVESSGTFVVNAKVKVKLSIPMDEPLDFHVAMEDTMRDGTPLTFNSPQDLIVTVPAGEKEVVAEFSFDVDPGDLGLSTSNRTTNEAAHARVSLTELARVTLKESLAMEFIVSKADAEVRLKFNYTKEDSGTGATGASAP